MASARVRLALFALLAVMLCGKPYGPARAGGGSFDDATDADDTRATLFGFVKDRNGNAIDDAKVTITMKKLNTDLVVRSDPQGHFITKLFYKNVDLNDIGLACAKDGYHQVASVPRPSPAAAAPLEIDCVLDHS